MGDGKPRRITAMVFIEKNPSAMPILFHAQIKISCRCGGNRKFSAKFRGDRQKFFHIALDKQAVHQAAAQNGITQHIAAKRSAIVGRLKNMRVPPLPIRPAQLLVHEPRWRFPARYLRAPAQRKAVHSQLIINQRARLHHNGRRREDFEIQPGWRDSLQVEGVREKRKHFCARSWQPLFPNQFMRHDTASRRRAQIQAREKRGK
jgi:hypothetical protein